MKTKGERHALIRKLIQEQHVATQDELCALLQQREGMMVTQATVSRDIKEMFLVKAPDGLGGYYYVCPQESASVLKKPGVKKPDLAVSILDVKSNDYLVVVHTLPGAANFLAATLDKARWPENMGTLAGDDTVFIALRSPKDKKSVLNRLQEMQG